MSACATRLTPWRVGIVIPARNEVDRIARCLDSLLTAARYAQRSESVWIVVVADSCTDDTAYVARRALGAHGQVIECVAGSAGLARRLGVDAALDHFRGWDPQHLWLANTDADTLVAADWIAVHIELAHQGITGVAGIVQLDELESPEMHALHLRNYALGADGTHAHVHGANMAVRADAYLDIGGWSALHLAEDHCLWRRLKLRGWCVRSTVASVVTTSARLHGRAAGGFADTMRTALETYCADT